jgi:predicted metal-dependent enzyme (double-stranded beta helix superfamily)
MKFRDWLVTDDGDCQPRPSARDWDLIRDKYYLHRFLTEIEDLLLSASHETEEWDYLPQIRMRVRQLVMNSYWLRTQYADPDPKTGAAVLTLYDEIGYPLTVQTVVFRPGVISPIHNHGTWGVVALIRGHEKHTFWQWVPDPDFPHHIEPVESKILQAGELISFTPGAIHHVEAVGAEPAFSFAIYGDTHSKRRFEFDPQTHTAKNF